jgi:hypothetical protein
MILQYTKKQKSCAVIKLLTSHYHKKTKNFPFADKKNIIFIMASSTTSTVNYDKKSNLFYP